MTHPYADIIHLPRYTSVSRPRMPAHDRAAQFAPFAALTGYDSAIAETARVTDRRIELDEVSKVHLNEKLCLLQDRLEELPPLQERGGDEQPGLRTDGNKQPRLLVDGCDEQLEVYVTYFVADKAKSGGTYLVVSGCVKKIDPYKRVMVLQDGAEIPIEDILEIDGPVFGVLES